MVRQTIFIGIACALSSAARADDILYNRVSQVVETTPGVYRDVVDIFAQDLQSGDAVRLTTAEHLQEFDNAGGTWSPDGMRVAFLTMRHRLEPTNGNSSELYVMSGVDLDGDGQGDNPVRLTSNEATDDDDPKWCGDDGGLIFARAVHSQGDSDIWMMDSEDSDGDGNGDNSAALIMGSTDDYMPDCSPDRSKIAFVRAVSPSDRKIVVADSDGSNPLVLTSTPSICSDPRWSPDGAWLAYACDHHDPQTNRQDIYRMRPADLFAPFGEGDERERLTVSPIGSTASGPVWSPDAVRIAYTRYTEPVNYSQWKTIGTADDSPIPGLSGRTAITDWR